MAVSTSTLVQNGLYVPYHSKYRGAHTTPVGTLYIDAGATGAAGGGTVTVAIAMRSQEFGFRLIWIPTHVSVRDNLATAEIVQFVIDANGNRRTSSAIVIPAVTVRDTSGENSILIDIGAIPLEGGSVAPADVLRAVWGTNTDTIGYHVHAFGPVYDLEQMAEIGDVPELMAGIR